MSGFDSRWLALREPADARARAPALSAALATWAAGRPLHIVDLGCGSGSNLRHLSPLLASPQRWTCVDDDPALLDHVAHEATADRFVETRRVDLARELDRALEPLPDVVTASALLDLVSVEWLRSLAEGVARRGAAALFVLSVDGRMEFQPAHPQDEPVRLAFEAHQRRDKGFGVAAGSDAIVALVPVFERLGYRVETKRSDWVLESPTDADLMAPLLGGIAAAAMEQGGGVVAASFSSWLQERLRSLEENRLRIVVGHLDVLALPATQ
ncbi:MAG: class I SAM-dependent methyltransferase [Steroidobacteraceae bacterium]